MDSPDKTNDWKDVLFSDFNVDKSPKNYNARLLLKHVTISPGSRFGWLTSRYDDLKLHTTRLLPRTFLRNLLSAPTLVAGLHSLRAQGRLQGMLFPCQSNRLPFHYVHR